MFLKHLFVFIFHSFLLLYVFASISILNTFVVGFSSLAHVHFQFLLFVIFVPCIIWCHFCFLPHLLCHVHFYNNYSVSFSSFARFGVAHPSRILPSKSLFHLHFFAIYFIVCICNNFNYSHICCGMFTFTTIAMFCFHCLQNLVQQVFHHVHVLTMFCNNVFFTLFSILFYAMDFYLYHIFLCSPFYCALFKIIVFFLFYVRSRFDNVYMLFIRSCIIAQCHHYESSEKSFYLHNIFSLYSSIVHILVLDHLQIYFTFVFVGFVSKQPLFSFCQDINNRHVFEMMNVLILCNYKMFCMYDLLLSKKFGDYVKARLAT